MAIALRPAPRAGFPPLRMNLVLFADHELTQPLPRNDPRARHILQVLRVPAGDTFDVGQLNGPRGKATLDKLTEATLELSFTWAAPHAPPPPTSLIIGLPRPQTARDVLRDATTLGATALHFVRTARSDPNYAASSLWQQGEWTRHVETGAAQAFDTFVPPVSWQHTLAEQLTATATVPVRLALDNYEATAPLATFDLPDAETAVTLFIGPERGWDEADRALFRAQGVPLLHLGSRVLRTETAVTAALALLNAARLRASV